MYAGSYTDDNLGWWAVRIHEWAGMGQDVFVYFNNDGDGSAVCNAARLRQDPGHVIIRCSSGHIDTCALLGLARAEVALQAQQERASASTSLERSDRL
jgi:hypothetical protein